MEAASKRGVEAKVVNVATREAVFPALEAAKASGADAINFLAKSALHYQRTAILDHVAALRLPAIYQWPERRRKAA